METETLSKRKSVCNRIVEALSSGATDRNELLKMVKDLNSLLHDMSWEVKSHRNGRNDSAEMQQAERLISSAKNSLAWVEKHAPFALTFELARCVQTATGAAMKVTEQLQAQRAGAAA